MTLSLCLTIHDRTPAVSRQVADSIRAQTVRPDEIVIALDRASDAVAQGAAEAYGGDLGGTDATSMRIITLNDGPPGWRSPVPAWNAAFKAATSDLLYCISSEVVQQPENIARAKALLEANPTAAVFGRCECSCGPTGTEVNWGGAAPGNLFADSKHPRPLGFIQAFPRSALVPLKGGFDPAFAAGLWFDDDDFAFRLWRDARLDFIFTDTIAGTHLHHDRPGLNSPEGQAKIAANAALIVRKHGHQNPIRSVHKAAIYRAGLTTWKHL